MILDKIDEDEKCPSCNLKLEDEEAERCTPRRVCHKLNQHLVIPLLLLPVILLLLGIFRLVARPDQDLLLFKSTVVRRGLGGITALSAGAGQTIVSDSFKESDEFEDRDLINGLKTSFVPLITNTLPLNVVHLPHQIKRQRRQLKEIVWDLYDMGNISNADTIEWATVKPPIRNTSSGKIDYLETKDRDTIKKDGSYKKYIQDLFQDDEQETSEVTAGHHIINGKQWNRKSFWDGETDQENIRKAQASIMLSLMNMNVDPCVDFYEYACGGWSNAHPIPKNRAGSGTIEILKSSIDEVVRRLLENDFNGTDGQIVKMVDNGQNEEFSAVKIEKITKSKNLSSTEIQGRVTVNHTNAVDSSLVSAVNEGVQPSGKKSKPDVTSIELSIDSDSEVQLKNSTKSLVKLSNGQNKEVSFSESLPMRKENHSKENSNLEYIHSSKIDYDAINSSKQGDSVGYNLNVSMLLGHFNEKNKTEGVLTKDISLGSYIDRNNFEKNIKTTSIALEIPLKGNDNISSSESTSEPVPVIFSQLKDYRTEVSNLRSRLKVLSEGENAEMLVNDVKTFKESKNIQDKSNDATKKAKNFYKSCINTDIIEKRAEAPLVKLLDELGGWPKQTGVRSLDQWTALAAKLRLYNNNILIAEWVGPDIHNSAEYIIQLDEAGLGLPTRDYFLSASNTESVKAYHQFIVTVAVLLGVSPKDAEKLADQLVNFEIHLALITASHEEKKNLTELYHRMTVSELSETIPGINWRQYLGIILNSTNPNFNLSSLNSTPVLVFALRYFHDLASLLNKYPPRVIQSYMLWRFVSHRAGNLDQRFWAARSQLRKMLTGREEAPPRWESCVAHTTAAIGHAVGSLFVKQHFDEQSKSDTLHMTTEIQAAFRQSLLDPNGATASWMDEETRSLAVEKADAMALRVGYPDLILDPDSLDLRYTDLKVDPEIYFENTLAVLKYLTRREHSLLGTAVDKTQWSAPPTEVNAFYSRNKNQIFLPAGILQPPFYHRHFPKSLNYGGVGVVIGHEMTHGFDDRGRLFDRHGNLQRWWQPTAIEAFQKRAECLVDQYEQYHVEEVSMKIDGIRTQSENIADNGGLKQAYKAYKNWLKSHTTEKSKGIEETLPGMDVSPRQLFFLNFAQVWCGALRPEAIKNKLKTSIHSLEKFRVIGTLSNSEEFSEAFSCPSGSPMNPQLKCSVW